MAASTALTDLIFDTGTATMSPIFPFDTKVYKKSEYLGTSNADFKYNPYTVKGIMAIPNDSGAYLDYNGVAADSDATLDIDTDNIDGSGTPDTAEESPFFYYVQNDANGKYSVIHESQLKSITGVELTVAGNASNWT